MKPLIKVIVSLFLYFPLHTMAEDNLEQWQEWLYELPALVDQHTASSSNHMKNYLQCMDDQQALNKNPDMTIGNLIDNALESGHQCAPLLNKALEDLTNLPIESLDNQQKQKLLEQSL